MYAAPNNSFESSYNSSSTRLSPFESSPYLKVLLLHGNLDICVYEGKNLPNMDLLHENLRVKVGKKLGRFSRRIDRHMSNRITSDPYVSIRVSKAVICRTRVISNNENPVWMQHFNVPVAHYASEVQFFVKDSDFIGSQLIGVVAIPVEWIYSGFKVEGSFPILNEYREPCRPGSVLSISIQYIPIDKQPIYQNGVPGTYFPLRKSGKITLYQDAHVPDGCLPVLKLDDGMYFEHGKCWEDIFKAISGARHLIYIAGWSVYHKIRLVRDGSNASDCTLGELLKLKSQEGVRVLLLVWDDPTSFNILGCPTNSGKMKTHDEETSKFFKHSSVHVLLCPRAYGEGHFMAKPEEIRKLTYAHHQKTVIVDADAGNSKRKIIAFVGGLDLCHGRYDTPTHSLFRTLQTVHKDDFYNPNFEGSDVNCPRQPWHDLHCKIDGPAAYDVLTNFDERWLKASVPHGLEKLRRRSYNDLLLKIESIPDIIGMLEAHCLHENDPETWHVQVLRSIDSNSVEGFPNDPNDATSKNLLCGKNLLIDMGIHTAYVKAIRAAQHFIYIENQYFLGSSYNWDAHKDLGADHLIPMEIALKIASKIKAKERFSVYIVIPMWPEGDPNKYPMDVILYWQHKTMKMMYGMVCKALEEAGLEKTSGPQDYLNFFCLGNREALGGNDASYVESPATETSPQALASKSRRFMIYVHSKGMIVDDEYVILGSANINQRSMEGTRDSEIAIGAYQPQHTWGRKISSPHGQIHGYRMSLWLEHIGVLEDCFAQPESLECVTRVRALAEMNWQQFASDEVMEMNGHLLKYPVEVDLKGNVMPLAGAETFLDMGGNIMGKFRKIEKSTTLTI